MRRIHVNHAGLSQPRRSHTLTDIIRAFIALNIVWSMNVARLYAQGQSPWERAAGNLELSFTGPLARSLSLVAIVLGGLAFMFGEAGAKKQISGIVFGGGLALFAAQFLTWLF
jgi:type IV secretory pathway VirB2 component (pilin)